MYTVYFKSGNTCEITQEMMNLIGNQISGNGSRDFQVFNNKETDNIFLIFRLTEIEFIKLTIAQ